MLGIQKLTHVTQVVENLDRAEALYRDVFGTREFHRGPLDHDTDTATFLVSQDLCLKLVTMNDFQKQISPSGIQCTEGFQAIGFRIRNLKIAEEFLRRENVRIILRSPSRVLTDPRDTHGTILELWTTNLPHELGDHPSSDSDRQRTPHPLAVQDIWAISLIVTDPNKVNAFWQRALGARPFRTRTTQEIARSITFIPVSGIPLAIVESAGEGSELASVTERFHGSQGIHAICLVSANLQDVPRHFRAHGIGLLKSPASRYLPHPRALMGARYIFMEPPSQAHL